LKAFEAAGKHFTLTGNKMLVERLDSGEVKSKGGLILAESPKHISDLKTQKPLVCIVLAVGEGYTGEDVTAAKIPTDVKPGNVVVLNALGVSFYSIVPGFPSFTDMKLGISSEGDVQMRFDSVGEFEQYAAAISAALNG
jgi:co-chaperonin GroES (HSP10)